jgi:hypothetical protein
MNSGCSLSYVALRKLEVGRDGCHPASISNVVGLHSDRISLRCIFIISIRLPVDLASSFSLHIFRPKFRMHFSSLMRATCSAYRNLILLYEVALERSEACAVVSAH